MEESANRGQLVEGESGEEGEDSLVIQKDLAGSLEEEDLGVLGDTVQERDREDGHRSKLSEPRWSALPQGHV